MTEQQFNIYECTVYNKDGWAFTYQPFRVVAPTRSVALEKARDKIKNSTTFSRAVYFKLDTLNIGIEQI